MKKGVLYPTLILFLSLGFLTACGSSSSTSSSSTTTSGTISVTHLSIPDGETTIYQYHPVKVKVGLKLDDSTSSASSEDISVVIGLVSPDDTSTACHLASQSVQLDTDGTETQITLIGYPSDDCLESGVTSRAVNISVSAHPADDLLTISDPEDQMIVHFTTSNIDDTANQACADANATAGCVIDLTLEPSPGLDVAVTSFAPESSVGILWSPTDSDHHAADVTLTAEVANKPNFVVDTDIEVVGLSPSTENALDGVGTVDVKYFIRPHSSTEAWMPLTIRAVGNHTATGHDTVVTLTNLPTPNEVSLEHDLYIEGTTYTAMATGGTWASEFDFDLMACVAPSFTEVAAVAGEALLDNCMIDRVTMANPRSKPDIMEQQPLNSWLSDIVVTVQDYSWSPNYRYVRTYGNSKQSLTLETIIRMGAGRQYRQTLGNQGTLNFEAGTQKLSGGARINLWVGLDGWISGVLINLGGYGNANLTDATVKYGYWETLVGHQLVYVSESRSMPVSYELPGIDKSFSKQLCISFGYYLVVAHMGVDVCATGSAGVKVGETLNFYNGGGSGDFASATVWGNMVVKVKPYAELDLTVAATIDLSALKASVGANLTLLNASLTSVNRTDGDSSLEDYSTGIVALGLIGNSVIFTVGADSDFTLSTLSGDVFATGSYWWWYWHSLGHHTITSWGGYSFSFPIYHGTLASTTISLL